MCVCAHVCLRPIAQCLYVHTYVCVYFVCVCGSVDPKKLFLLWATLLSFVAIVFQPVT